MTDRPSVPEDAAELEELRARLTGAEEALRAIRDGTADGVLGTGEHADHVYTLRGADRAYRQLIESMSEAAVTLSATGIIVYSNVRLAEMLGRPLDGVLGTDLRDYLPQVDQQVFDSALEQALGEPSRQEISLMASDGRLVPIHLSASRLHGEGAEMVFCLVLTDLTQQRRHEQVAAEEQLSRLILVQAAEAIVVCDRRGRIIRASLAVQQFCDGSALGRPFFEVLPLHSDHSRPFDLARVLQGETIRNLEVHLDRRGQELTFILNAGPLVGGQGTLGCVVTLTDISERQRAVETLARESHRSNMFLRNASDGIHILDGDGNVLEVSDSFCRNLGYSREELIGANVSLWDARWSPQELKDRLAERAAEPGHREFETRHRHRDGTVRDVEVTTQSLELDGRPALFASQRDITKRKRAEVGRRESEARLAGIIDSAIDGIVALDDQDRVVLFNAGAEAMFGCPGAEAVGQSVERFIPERFRAEYHGHMERLAGMDATNRAALGLLRLRGLRSGGEEFSIEASASQTEVGGHTLFTIFLRDISERLRSEAANAALERQLFLGRKLDALGTLASGIAHDFNNILGTIIGNTELATQDVAGNQSALESLDEIRRASQRARVLVQRILNFASGRHEERRVVPLRPVVEEAIVLLRATLPAAVEIAATFDADAPMVLAGPTDIHQILVNLCTNASNAMEGHPGRIDIGLDGVTLDADAARAAGNLPPGRFARLSVTDTGKGMDAATLLTIFDPFFTTMPVGQGSGLGLFLVHGTVKAYDGAIGVTSQPGKGTTFLLYFPAAQAREESAAPEGPAPAAESRPAAGGRHVLYLDDEEQLVFLVKRMLERLGYRVSGYTRAEDALAALRADPRQFDLVVTDLNMPGMSGLDVAREVSRLRPGLPVALASGYVTDELREQAMEAGVRQVIYKPNTVAELCDAVQSLAVEHRDG